jgi:hypothetical protein
VSNLALHGVGAVVTRREPFAQPSRTASARNVRPVEAVYPHRAAEPIHYGDTPARPARMPIATFLHIAPYHAVQRDDFWINVLIPNKIASKPPRLNGQLPWDERANISIPPAEAYGSLVTLDPQDPYAIL